MSQLKLSAGEQNVLAEFSALAKTISYAFTQRNPDYDNIRLVAGERFVEILDRFDRIRYDDLYDRLHRTGENSDV
jgi:hypothetical protein